MTLEMTQRCGVCRCYMDKEDLFCANCGTENPFAEEVGRALAHQANHHSFDCTSCGASMSYDASAQALRCPFCGSSKMERRESARSITPNGVVPFAINRQKAEKILREWLGRGFWRPDDAARASTIGEMADVYVPYWVFDAKTDTLFTADSSPAPPGSRGDWYPVTGTNSAHYSGILIAGSSILAGSETQAIAPFRIDSAVAPTEVDLENAIYEEFRVPRKLARPLARGAIESMEREACARKVPNRHRKVQVNTSISNMHGLPMLLPVWILAYRYKDKVHRVLINGQSGKISGSAPFSYGKLGVILLVVATVIATIVAIVAVANM
jgi:predicted RNA-binding Zn-ribbon protein involved in translation (DUF1610 family)